jgi:hypothetical protein
MRVPGRAWLEFETRPEGEGTRLVQTAYFAPRGLAGLLYWYGMYPAHGCIFSGMIHALADASHGARPDVARAEEAGGVDARPTAERRQGA